VAPHAMAAPIQPAFSKCRSCNRIRTGCEDQAGEERDDPRATTAATPPRRSSLAGLVVRRGHGQELAEHRDVDDCGDCQQGRTNAWPPLSRPSKMSPSP